MSKIGQNSMKKWPFFAIILPWMASYGSERSFLLIFSARDDLVKVSWKLDARKCQNQLTPPYFDQLRERHQPLSHCECPMQCYDISDLLVFFIWSVPDLCVFQVLPSCFKYKSHRFINFGWEIFFRYEKKLQFLFLLLSCGCSKGLCQWQWGEGKIILQICNCTQIHQPVTHCWANWI